MSGRNTGADKAAGASSNREWREGSDGIEPADEGNPNGLLAPFLSQPGRSSAPKRTRQELLVKNEYPAQPADMPRAAGSDVAHKSPDAAAKPQQDWTVIVDLGILFDSKGPHGNLGAQDKLERLKELKEMTKGRPVTIVVRALQAPDGADKLTDISKSNDPYRLTRMVLKDGQEIDTFEGPSKGAAEDLKGIIQLAVKENPSNKIALDFNLHGLGDQGFAGGMEERQSRVNGRFTPQQLAQIIHDGLAGSGHDKADVVVADSCLASQVGVLNSMSPVAQNVVLSELSEHVIGGAYNPNVDGQNMNSWLSQLIDNPSMNGSELAKAIVHQADAGANTAMLNGRLVGDGTETLAAFDLEHGLKQFDQRLNALGAQLCVALQDPRNILAIETAVDALPDLGEDKAIGSAELPSTMAKRDLDTFLLCLESKLSVGGITDPDNQLRARVDELRSYLKDTHGLMLAFHSSSASDLSATTSQFRLDHKGGLSIYLEDSNARTNPSINDKTLGANYDMESGTATGATTESGWKRFMLTERKPRQHSIFDPPGV
jgi:hypothetical protein